MTREVYRYQIVPVYFGGTENAKKFVSSLGELAKQNKMSVSAFVRKVLIEYLQSLETLKAEVEK